MTKNYYKRLLTVCLTAVALSAQALEYYDITTHYLQNSRFDAAVDYDRNATGDVTNTVTTTIKGWKLTEGSKTTLSTAATFQYGTAATFYGVAIPATAPDGTADGVCLTLCAALRNEVSFAQNAVLPPGNYRMIVTWQNCNTASDAGISRSGWWVSATDNQLSERQTFPYGQWTNDTIDFTLTEVTKGQLQVGFKSPTGLTAKSALLAIDQVRLLRDTPYGEIDDVVPAPTVVTDKRFARGATMAFGRIGSVKGDDIESRGFCYAEHPDPTIDDMTTDATLNGNIYWMKDLKPATLYYMRAYAVNSAGKAGYGEAIKFYTIPKGNVTYSLWRGEADDAIYNRINQAIADACYYFNNLTSTTRDFDVAYSPGTPTADCNYTYRPHMNVGANVSYQRTGTIMHEMQHGLGLQNYSTQWNGNILRSGNGTGQWLGDRVTELLHFWDNNNSTVLSGDNIHMWPYGINGAHEDNGSEALYIINAMICQALGEDGLEHNETRHADPYYALYQEDDIKYYIKNEDEGRGLYTSYLVPTATGTLQWRTLTTAEAAANDSAAWYITFTPKNQYYQLRNAAMGQYMTYSSGFRTLKRTSVTTNDNFHLMKGRVDVAGIKGLRGYWLIHPASNWSPQCMQAGADGKISAATFNLANTATTQRWLILSADQAVEMETQALASMKKKATDYLAPIKELANVPHREVANGTDAAFATDLAELEQQLATAATTTAVAGIQALADTAAFRFLTKVIATDETNPFNLTYRLANPGMDSADGWSVAPAISYSCGEFYEKTFDIYQTIADLPAGDYIFRVQGFQRPGSNANCATAETTAYLYAGNKQEKLVHVTTGAQTSSIGGNEATIDGKLVPNNMQAASLYFKRGYYENSVATTIASDHDKLRAGIRSSSMGGSYWCIFDNFRLHYLGNSNATAIDPIVTETAAANDRQGVYSLDGRRLFNDASQAGKLARGIYVINGKKTIVK